VPQAFLPNVRHFGAKMSVTNTFCKRARCQNNRTLAGSGPLALAPVKRCIDNISFKTEGHRTVAMPASVAVDPRNDAVAVSPDDHRTRSKEEQMSQLSQSTATNEVDVRSLMPAQRHQKIFQLVGQLSPGSSFILVNDHDPKPLYYQLEAEYPRQFSWTYLEKGPDAWRVEIGRGKTAA
jgi:uncharacterized protein (DUF2249 family)